MTEIIIVGAMLILHLFFKTDRTKLYCGIFAFSGKKNISNDLLKTALLKIHILGLYNESRGVHGCGLYAGGVVYKGINNLKLYSDFITSNEFPLNKKENVNVLIGHCRQASRGDHSIENTHPFVVSNNKTNRNMIAVHNGTITNIYELCKKYEIETKNISNDSRLLFSILANRGTKVLSEYIGGAALIWTDEKSNTLYVFRGKSKNFYHDQEHEERPLYFLMAKEGIYFSSLEEPLFAVSENDEMPLEVKCNMLYTIKDGVFVQEEQIDRQNLFPKPVHNNQINLFSSSTSTTTVSKKSASPKIWKEKPFTTQPRVNYCNGRFYFNGELCQGQLRLDSKGYVNSNVGLVATYYLFHRGVMLSSATYSEFLKDSNPTLTNYANGNFAKAISKYSLYPVTNLPAECTYGNNKEERFFWFDKEKLANVTFSAKFSPRSYRIENGILDKIKSSLRDEKVENDIYYKTYNEAFENKKLYFENVKMPFTEEKSSNSFSSNIPEDSSLKKYFFSYDELERNITDVENDAVFLLSEDILRREGIDPTAREIENYKDALFYNAIKTLSKFVDTLTKAELFKLEYYYEELSQADQLINKEEENNKIMTEEKLINVIEDFENISKLTEDLEIIDHEFAQESAAELRKQVLQFRKKLLDLCEKYNSEKIEKELIVSKLLTTF